MVCLSTFTLSANAQQNSAPLQTPVTTLIQSYKAMAATSSVTDVTVAGTARRISGSDDETGDVTVKALISGESSFVFSYPSGQLSETRTNTTKGPIGQWIGSDSKPHAVPQHNLLTDSSWFFPPM